MASIVWTGTYVWLALELILTFILVIPFPKKIRNIIARRVFQLKIYELFHKPLWFIATGLVFGFADSYNQWQLILERASSEGGEHEAGAVYHHNLEQERIYHDLDKQRKYKCERNMYLSGFALTLLFVIGRITELMKESVELEEQVQRATASTTTEATISSSAATGKEQEMSLISKTKKPEQKRRTKKCPNTI